MADSIPTPVSKEPEEDTQSVTPNSRRKGIAIVVVVILVLVAAGLWWRSTYTEDTDDAQVNGHLIQVSARISGQVAKVYVDENQVVKAGDVIAELDPSDYKVAVENAEAALASAQANADAAKVNVPITSVNTGSTLLSADAGVSSAHASVEQAEQQLEAAHAQVAQAKANNTKAQADLERYKPLVEKDVISKQQFDAAVAAADASKAALSSA
ncbi:MAG TPA: biotin/lipoyl-binding protein, partial [Terracidiphilus sp.]